LKSERQEAVLRLVRTGTFKTQEELVDALAAAGFAAGQATVSRDIRELGLVKIPGPDGEKYFAPPTAVSAPDGENRLRKWFRESALSWEASGPLVVIRTPPGEAPVLAHALDQAAWPQVLAALTGNDVVMVVSREGQVHTLLERLAELGGGR